MKKPKRLRQGDTIGIIAPAGAVYIEQNIINGVKILENLGYKVILGKSCSLKYGYLAGEDLIRAEDFNGFFNNDDINAIICLRGGYGSARIIDKINYDIVKDKPKIFVGYSDITAIHSAISKKCEMVTFHGPMLASDIAHNDMLSINSLINCLSGNLKEKSYSLIPINEGRIEGKIFGGNLSLICSLLKTKYEVDYEDKIVFLEEINEEPYSIDRMLQHLKLCGIFKKAKGVVLGQFTNCETEEKDKSFSLEYLLNEFFTKIDIPVYYGLPAGHESSKITLPLGVKIKIKNDIMYFTEEGVS